MSNNYHFTRDFFRKKIIKDRLKIITPMIIYLLLLSVTHGSLIKKSESNWFKESLTTNSKKKRCIEFDFMTSMIFMKKENKTAAYSPICSDLNIIVQCMNDDFGSKYSLKATKNYNYVMKQLKKINPDKFKILNCFYKKVEILQNDTVADDYLYKVFMMTDAERIYNEHVDWVIKQSDGLFASPFDLSSFKFFNGIYASMVHFKDDWARMFDVEESYLGEFYLNETLTQSRNFMYKHDNYFYKMINGEIIYEIVAIPYSARKGEPYPRFMVYLVPVKYETNLFKIWDNFYTICSGDIQNFIKKELHLREVKLHVPKIKEFKSAFDLRELLDMIFKNNTVNSSSKIITCVIVDETGTKDVVVPFSLFDIVDFNFGLITVKADRPHLSFIFDMETQRILFVTKDTGY